MDSRDFGKLPSNNLGAKYLDDRQMEANFPDYQALLDRIEAQREIAAFAGETFGREEIWHHYPQMYDNVFAILGGRGSGKSSVIQSLRERMLNNQQNSDIILPIIIPETISDPRCSILGWIMATLEQTIDSIENQFRNLENSKGGRWVCDHMPSDNMVFFKDCHLQSSNQLRERYESLKRDCIPDHIPASTYSYDDMVGLQVHLSQKQYALIRNLNVFWNEITTYWKMVKILQAKADNKNDWAVPSPQPLIILMFDDVDLVPERSLELLNSTFQYFTNPNIILILTAAEKVLEQVIWIKMLERMVASNYRSLFTDFYPKESLEKDPKDKLSLECIDKMAREYYDKVVPPANRYHLRRYPTIAERKRYRYASMGQSFRLPPEDVSIRLDSFLINQIQILKKDTNDPTFICDGRGRLHEAYLLMFGEKSRNIANGCLAILNCVDRLKRYAVCADAKVTIQQRWSQIYDALRQLLYTLTASNRMVKELGNDALKLLYQAGSSGEVQVDYDGLWNLYAKRRENLSNRQLKSYERIAQRADVEDAELESAFLLSEQEWLGKLQKQMAILLVMLTFVDKLRALASSWFSDIVADQGTSLEGGRGLSAMLNANACTVLSKEELVQAWSWLVLFPRNLGIDAFLTRSPYALEHVDHYVEFDPFDLFKVQEYLMDTFYASTVCYEEGVDTEDTVEEQIQLGDCSPESLLVQGLPEDRNWVESVLSMLFLRYSGITAVNPGILHFSLDSRRMLEHFRFGGHLNRQIKENLAGFLKADLSYHTLQDNLKIYFIKLKEMPELDIEKLDIIKEFSRCKTEPIDKVFSLYTDNCPEKMRRELAEWYVAKRMAEASEQVTEENFGRWVIEEVETDIKEISACLTRESGMMLTLESSKDLLKLINEIPIIANDLRDVCNACKLALEGVVRELSKDDDVKSTESPSGHNDQAVPKVNMEAKADVPSTQSGESSKTAIFSLPMLLEYIRILDKEIARMNMSGDSAIDYWKTEMIRGYFKLSSMLNPIIDPTKADKSVVIPDANKSYPKGTITLPRNGWLVLMLSMVEYLMPIYFTARLVQQDDRRRDEPYYGMSFSQYAQEETVSRQLENMYRELLAGKGDSRLIQLMEDARDRMVELYIERLERVNDE